MGGTFTDLVSFDGASLHRVKVPSTPPHFERGVTEALRLLGRGLGEVNRPIELVHGSTIATNALLERRVAPVAFITTRGFRDLLHIGRQNRPELYALHVRRPSALVPRERCYTVVGRIDARGEIVEPLDDGEAERVARCIADSGIRHVAVCLLFSFANDEHEQRVAAICRAHGLTVTLSSEIVPEFREYERASTAVVTAALRPTVEEYLLRLRDDVPPRVGHIRILHGGGGTYHVEQAATNAARLVLSGPAGGVAGAAMIARLAGFPDAVGFDMGGTSTDVALIRAGRPQFAQQHAVDGLPVHLPMLDIHTIGAGGGSVAYLDQAGSLRAGPRSAGARPGPACYGRGGTEPTVTDANVVLGRIPHDARFGELEIDPGLARSAFAPLAERLRLSVEDAALGVLKVSEQSMSGAVRVVTAQRGHDLRRLALVSFGGAGGLHACAVAELLDMQTVVLPPMAGVLSALGMVIAADSVDVSRTTLQLERAGRLDDARIGAEFGRLNLLAMNGLPPARTATAEMFADCRWTGQSHELTVSVSRPERASIGRAFAALYASTYGTAPPARQVEIVTLRLRRTGLAPQLTLPNIKIDGDSVAERDIELVDGSARLVRARCTGRAPLTDSVQRSGPLLIVEADATAFVPAGWRVAGRPDGVVIAKRAPEPS